MYDGWDRETTNPLALVPKPAIYISRRAHLTGLSSEFPVLGSELDDDVSEALLFLGTWSKLWRSSEDDHPCPVA